MIKIVTMLWDKNDESYGFSSMYTEAWVEKLYRGVKRNLTQPFEFICYVDRERQFSEPIRQMQIRNDPPSYCDYTQPYELNEPMILMGLDTIIIGNIDHLADYCFTADKLAVPAAIYRPNTVCNAVALVPAGQKWVFDGWKGENDMEVMRRHYAAKRIDMLDEVFPGEIVSYKKHVKPNGLRNARIVFFHGEEKAHQLNLSWIRENWV